MLQGHGHSDNLNEAAHIQPTVQPTSVTPQLHSHQPNYLMSFLRMEVSSAPVTTSRVRRAQGPCTEVHICNPSRLKEEYHEYGASLSLSKTLPQNSKPKQTAGLEAGDSNLSPITCC